MVIFIVKKAFNGKKFISPYKSETIKVDFDLAKEIRTIGVPISSQSAWVLGLLHDGDSRHEMDEGENRWWGNKAGVGNEEGNNLISKT